MNRCIARGASYLLVISALSLAAAAPAKAQRFDGNWSVLIVTDSGDCDRAYRYGVRIAGGQVSYAGDASVSFSGSVSGDGRVHVTVRAGNQSASGSGRLSGNSGGGSWAGSSPTNRCSGHWEAERR
jgi:hypothetical protein